MSETTTEQVSKEDAARLITESAWTTGLHECDYCDHKCGEARQVIHTRTPHGFGADWDLVDALKLVVRSTSIEWRNLILGRALVVTSIDGDGSEKVYAFDELRASS